MNVSRILCATDFSSPADYAFQYAVFLTKTHNADLVLIHVAAVLSEFAYHESIALTLPEVSGRLEKHALEQLQSMADEVKDSVSVALVLRHGTAWAEICEVAQQEAADIIVIGSHGRTGLSHVLLGSVAEKVVRHAPCPVLVARSSAG